MFEEVKNIDRVRNVIKRHKKAQFKINWPHFIMREDTGFPETF